MGYICPAGFYCTAGTVKEQACWLGTYQQDEGQDNCTTCPAGYMCDEFNMTTPNVCKTGEYQALGEEGGGAGNLPAGRGPRQLYDLPCGVYV